jgi:hypothetical protein
VGQAEIANLGPPKLILSLRGNHEDVVQLDVVVDDALLVDVLKTLQNVLSI